MKNILEAAEMWFLKIMPRVPWIAKKINLAEMEMVGTSRELMTTRRCRQFCHLGHTLKGISFEKYRLLGARGRQRFKYMDRIRTLVGSRTASEVVRLTENRGR